MKQIGGPGEDRAGGVALDPNGQPVVAGSYQGMGKLDVSVTVFSPSARELFVAKYDSTGELQWHRTSMGDEQTAANVADVATGPDGTIGVVGSFTGSLIIEGSCYAYWLRILMYCLLGLMTMGTSVWTSSFGGGGEDTGQSCGKFGWKHFCYGYFSAT